MKDLFNENGELLNENFILNKLCTKTDWIREVMTLKKVFCNLVMKFDTDGYKYVNTQNIYLNGVVIGNGTYQLNSLRVKDFYNTLLLRPHTEHMWQTLTDTKFSEIEWQNIYKRNYKTQLKNLRSSNIKF